VSVLQHHQCNKLRTRSDSFRIIWQVLLLKDCINPKKCIMGLFENSSLLTYFFPYLSLRDRDRELLSIS
jgi:hypothetical protein